MAEVAEVARVAAGLALFLFPGLAWVLALAPGIGWARTAALGLVAAFTMAPAALFILNVFFGVPLRLGTFAFMAAGLGMAGLAVALARPLLADLE